MHHKEKTGWIKHIDFILLDMICLQLAFVAAYFVRLGVANPYKSSDYRSVAVVLALAQFMLAVFGNNFKNVLRRGFFVELMATVKLGTYVTLFGIGYLFLVKAGGGFSRMIMFLSGIIYVLLAYFIRLIWRAVLKKRYARREGNKSLLVITTSDKAERVLERIKEHGFHEYQLTGMSFWMRIIRVKPCIMWK